MATQSTSQATARRFDVPSTGGTHLAVWVEGQGLPIVMVHGSIADHTTFESLVGALGSGLTTFAMDRRGFGGSGDAPDYAIERDFEDVAAVVDEVAASTGGPVALWGHSYGAGCAMGGAALTGNVSHLILYEPGLGLSYASNTIEAIESALAAGDRETAIVTVLADLLELTEEEIDAFRASPLWPLRLAVAATIPRECRVEDSWVYRPGAFESITAPILMLAGSESPPSLKECTRLALDALPAATQLQVLDGHAHLAHKADPDLVAGIIREFVSS